MSDPAKNFLQHMVKMNLEQGYEALEGNHFDISIQHLEEATSQVHQMKALHEQSKNLPPQQDNQTFLDIP